MRTGNYGGENGHEAAHLFPKGCKLRVANLENATVEECFSWPCPEIPWTWPDI